MGNYSRTKACLVCQMVKTIKSWYANSVCSTCHQKTIPRAKRRETETTLKLTPKR